VEGPGRPGPRPHCGGVGVNTWPTSVVDWRQLTSQLGHGDLVCVVHGRVDAIRGDDPAARGRPVVRRRGPVRPPHRGTPSHARVRAAAERPAFQDRLRSVRLTDRGLPRAVDPPRRRGRRAGRHPRR
jgi:hypothetical protein